MYRVSVIMPVYNNEDTLEAAIESILNQTIPGFELILINDGSTDRSTEICERYAKKEPLLIEVIHQTHQGFFAAMNKGILNSSGKYIYFANPHDHFDRRLLEVNVNLAGEKEVDVVVFGFTTRTNSNDLENHLPRMPLISNHYEFRNHFRNFYHFYPFELFNKMYKRDFIIENRLLFQTNTIFGRHYFNLKIFGQLESVVFNRGSYMHRTDKPFRIVDETATYVELHKNFITRFRQLLQDWGYGIEYRDLVAEECYTLVYNELRKVTAKNSPLTYDNQIDYMNTILKDEMLQSHLEHLELLVDKSAYNRVLLYQVQKGNGKNVVDLMTRRNDARKLKSKMKSFMGNLFG